MKTQVREYKNQRWVWNELGIEVFDLLRDKRHLASWQEVIGISGRFVNMRNGMSLLLAMPVEEMRLLSKELGRVFREYNPCAWAQATRNSIVRQRRACLVFAPVFTFLIIVIPWFVLYIMIITTGADSDLPELTTTCIKWMILGLCSVLIFPTLYFLKLRSDLSGALVEAKEVELQFGCQNSG